MVKAYLDIETSFLGEITVIGLFAEDRELVQLVGSGITDLALWKALEGIQVICTYNGSRFDLPVIRRHLHLDLRTSFGIAQDQINALDGRDPLRGGLGITAGHHDKGQRIPPNGPADELTRIGIGPLGHRTGIDHVHLGGLGEGD